LAREHYENFPVASRLLPRSMRPHVAAVYAFARYADDFADEGTDSVDVRLAKLDDWARRLHLAAQGAPVDDGTEAGAVFVALAETIAVCRLDVALFDDLLSAFRQDVTVHRYETWPDLLDYCRRSANPVGRLVLGIAGYRDAALATASDALCTALQLTNFWQDLAADWRKGRLYVPLSGVRESGADARDLDQSRITPAWRAALADASSRTRQLFREGRPVAGGVPGRLGWELRATWLGGARVLDAIERADFDVFTARPALGWRDAWPIAWQMITWPQEDHSW
jgi:squalene synthase HpnC